MKAVNLSQNQISTLKKIGFRDQELIHFTPAMADNTIKKYYKMNRRTRKEIHNVMRRA
jgi:hypothetical protein